MTTRRTFVSFLSALGTYAAFPDCQAAATAPKIKVGQIGTKHAHASGKVGTARKFPELYDFVGIPLRAFNSFQQITTYFFCHTVALHLFISN